MATYRWIGGTGDWAERANWVPAGVPGVGDAALIDTGSGDTISITSPVSVRNIMLSADSTLAIVGTLSLGGTLTQTAGTFSLGNGGRIVGGTLAFVGGRQTYFLGTLQGVGIIGTLDLSANQSTVTVMDVLTVRDARGAPGLIDLTGDGAELRATGNLVLNDARLDFGFGGVPARGESGLGAPELRHESMGDTPTTLTLGRNLTVRLARYANLNTGSLQGDRLVNATTLTADWRGGKVTITGSGSFLNAGTISVTNGDKVQIYSQLINPGAMSVSGTDSLLQLNRFADSTDSPGNVTVGTGGTLRLIAEYTTSQLVGIRSVGTLWLSGHLDNTGAIFNAAAFGAVRNTGSFVGGVVRNAQLITYVDPEILPGQGSYRDQIIDGTIDMSAANSKLAFIGDVRLRDNAGTGPGALLVTGTGSVFQAYDTITLNTATLTLGSDDPSNRSVIRTSALGGNASTLTFGPDLTVVSAGSSNIVVGDNPQARVVNNTTILFNSGGAQHDIFSRDSFFTSGVGTFVNAGRMGVANGDFLTVDKVVFENDGVFSLASRGIAEFSTGSSITGTGSFSIDGATLALVTAFAQTIDFSGTGSRILFGDPSEFTGTLANLSAGDVIDMVGLTVTAAQLTATTLTLTADGVTYRFNVTTPDGIAIGAAPVLADDGNTGTTVTIACFVAGTRIAVPGGEVDVADLAIGDTVRTRGGVARVRWLGRRSYKPGHNDPAVRPVRIGVGALGGGLPRRPLLVSPQHAVLAAGMLVPASALLDGDQVRWAEGDAVSYVHVEVAGHDLIAAEGAWAETFVDRVGRGLFDNAAEYAALYPNEPARSWPAPARFASGGDALRQIRASLGLREAPETGGRLIGFVERVGRVAGGWRVEGWAHDGGGPVTLLVDGVVVRAECWRADLVRAGIGDGRAGFDVVVARPAASVTRAADGAALSLLQSAA